MPMTIAWRNALGDHSIGKTDVGALGDIWLALFTSNPTDSGSQASEVSGTGYVRINITALLSAFADSSDGEYSVAVNTATINFGTPGSNWGTITHVGLMTAVSAGTMRFFEQLTEPKVAPANGRTVKFTTGYLEFRFT